MAGFLAPQISELGAAPSQGAQPVDRSGGALFSGLANLIDLGGRAVGDGADTSTQTDRDDAAVQPFVNRMRVLTAARDSGKMGAAEYKARANALQKETIAAIPHLGEQIRNNFNSISGQPFVEDNIVVQVNAARDEWLVNTPEGQAASVVALSDATDPKTGQVDQVAAQLSLDRAYTESVFKDADAKARSAEIEKLKQANEYQNVKQAAFIDPLLSEQAAAAVRNLDAFMAVTLVSGGAINTEEEALQGLVELADLKASARAAFTAEAGKIGILDESTYLSGLNVVMQQFDAVESTLQKIVDRPEAQANMLSKRADIDTSRFLTSVGLPGNPRIFQTLAPMLLANQAFDIAQGLKAFTPTRSATSVLSSAAPNPDAPKDIINPAFTAEVASMSEAEQAENTQIGLARFFQFGAITKEDFKDESVREQVVEGFAIATATLDATRNPVSEETFDRVYTPETLNIYKRLVAFGDAGSEAMKKAVSNNLAITLSKRVDFATAKLSGSRATEQFPSAEITFDGSTFIVDFGSGKGGTQAEADAFKALDSRGLPHTSEGIQQFLNEENISASLGVRATVDIDTQPLVAIFREMQGELDYLNKIVGTAKKFDGTPNALPDATPARENVAVTTVSDAAGYAALPVGAAYNWVDTEDGSIVSDVKGEER